MKKIRLLLCSILMFCFGLILPTAAISQAAPEREDFKQAIDPFGITLYEGSYYKKPIRSWALAPGMRMLKIPSITHPNKQVFRFRPASVLLGSKVGAYLFPSGNFTSDIHKGNIPGWDSWDSWYLQPYFRFLNSSPSIPYQIKNLPMIREYSLVLHRKDIPDLLGVYLISGDESSESSSGRFYSLPQQSSDTAIVYNQIPYTGEPFRLQLIPGGKHQLAWSAKGASHPNANDIDITVDFSSGYSKKLPEKTTGSPPSSWNLSQFSRGPLASLKMRYVGPFSAPHYSQQQPHKHRAPPAKPKSPSTMQVQETPWQPMHTPPQGEIGPAPNYYIPRPGAPLATQSMSTPEMGGRGPEGWCCRAGGVFQGFLIPCEQSGGVLFLTPQEAHHHCEVQRGASHPMAPSRGTAPREHQPEGWCCSNGQVFPSLGDECARRGGIIFSPDRGEVQQHCSGMQPPPGVMPMHVPEPEYHGGMRQRPPEARQVPAPIPMQRMEPESIRPVPAQVMEMAPSPEIIRGEPIPMPEAERIR